MRKAQDPAAKGILDQDLEDGDIILQTNINPLHVHDTPKDIDVLVKLLPYYDIDLVL